MRLIENNERLSHEFRHRVVTISPGEEFSWRYGDTTVLYRRPPSSIRADATRMHPEDSHAATDRIFAYAILNWTGVESSNGHPLSYEPRYIRGLPFDFRAAFSLQINQNTPPGFDVGDAYTNVTYRRVPAHVQRSLEERHSSRGSVDLHDLTSNILEYCLLDWENVVDIVGNPVHCHPDVFPYLPDIFRGQVIELAYGTTLEDELGNSNGALRPITPSEVLHATNAETS